MRIVHRSCIVLVGYLLIAAPDASRARAEGDIRILRFQELTQPTTSATRTPAAQQTVPAPAVEQPTTPQPPQASTPPRSFPRLGASAPVFTQPLIEPQVTTQTRQALGFYGGYSARATLSQLPRRAPIQPSSSQPIRRQAKPFETIHREPTVSPYLNLYRDEENTESAPNYFAFVRPQMEQLDANRLQQREIQQLRGQLQTMSPNVVGPRYETSVLPGTGTSARYMDTAQFYGGWRR